MWKLEKIHAINLCAFRELNYELNQGHTTLVFGNNMDNDSQVSNGSGKSAMIEAIAIGLTGDPLRKIKMDEIINDMADEAAITLSLYNDMTSDRFIINRVLSRKNPQSIVLQLGEATEGEIPMVVQPNVLEYNRFILDTLGLTKDDIFANFILSKHKYTSFLSSSDRDKKEIINRFSNGIMVDESIAALQEDMEPVAITLREDESIVAHCKGRVDAVDEQIATTINESEERARSKQERIDNWKQKISEKRGFIRDQGILKDRALTTLETYDSTYNQLEGLEGTDCDWQEAYDSIQKALAKVQLPAIADYTKEMADKKQALADQEQALADVKVQIKDHAKKCKEANKKHSELKKEFDTFQATYDTQYAEISGTIDNLLTEVRALEKEGQALQQKRINLNNAVAETQKKLAGTITCPKCKHEFLLASTENVKELREDLNELQATVADIEGEIESNQNNITVTTEKGRKARQSQNALMGQKSDWSARVTESQTLVDQLSRTSNRLDANMDSIESKIASCQKSINECKTQMFDDAFGIIDDYTKKLEADVKQYDLNVSTAKGSIKSIEETVAELEKSTDDDVLATLRASKEKYEAELNTAISNKETVEQKLAEYKKQEATFIEFKTHLANSKIEALSHITNEFLEKIGSDIRIAFSGFTVLKSGKIKDKISISLLRDGVDCGSFDKFSEGEKARANLANILALHKLTNVNCSEGKGLDLLVLDEILEACDEAGLANMFEALNSLQITSLVVSHGNIAENYPHKLIINKQNGTSFI